MVTETDRTQRRSAQARRREMLPYADTVLDAFGPGRLMFGSDWPVCTLATTYGGVSLMADGLTLDLSSDERAQVFEGTAERVYRL